MNNDIVVFTNISEHDLLDEDIQVCIEALGLEEVLYQIGFDKEYLRFQEVGAFYETLECNHKTREGKVVFGKLYIGREREDELWLKSGCASEEVKMASKKDISYLKEIKELSKRSR